MAKLGTRVLPTDFRLYLITDRHQSGGSPLLEVVKASLEGGCKAVQLREKDLSPAEMYRLAKELRELTSRFGAALVINDRIDIAIAVEADGVHLGCNSLPVAMARKILGSDKIIGYSAHAIDEAIQVQAEGADFVTFGPVFATPSKAAYGEPCGVKVLIQAADALEIPVFGLGGISLKEVGEVLSASVHGVAVISAVMAVPDPFSATVSLIKMIEAYAEHS